MNKTLLILMVTCLTLIQCRRSTTDEEKNIPEEIIDQLEYPASEKKIYYRFPSPEEVIRYIHDEDLTFQEELVNPVNNAALYIDSKSQSISLGIYISDLVYATLFRKANLAADYLEVVQRLSDALHINYIEKSEIIGRVKNNFSNLDSLMSISRDSYNFMVDYLVETNNEKTLALISAGAYIEALYLVFNQIHDFSIDNEILVRVLEQKYAFSNLIKYMEEFQEIPQVKIVVEEMKIIQTAFGNITFEASGKAGFTNKDGELVLTGSKKKAVIDEDQVGYLKERINSLRNKFVQDL